MHSILIVEDDTALQEALLDIVQQAGYAVTAVDNGHDALRWLKEETPSLILSDIRMDKMTGFQLLQQIQKRWSSIPVIMMTAYAKVDDAVSLMREGAVDYISKPFDKKTLLDRIEKYLKPAFQGDTPVTGDVRSQKLLSIAERVAQTDASVLITGESGTGKEVLARYIHDHSPRSVHDFIAINCAAIPEQMLEATLFGYEKGAFTGAYRTTPGKFEAADQGTLLLDEVTEMSLDLQAKFLRVLQEREVERLGATKPLRVNVRVIATSNRSLEEQVQKGLFREDLWFRLNVFPLQWPPLRKRKDDILPLARYLISKHCRDKSMQPSLSTTAETCLKNYDWPGNARELDNAIQRALVLQPTGILEAAHFGMVNGKMDTQAWMETLYEGMTNDTD